jgi:hypothetical protein
LGEVLERADTEEGATVVTIRVPRERDAAFRLAFPDARTVR